MKDSSSLTTFNLYTDGGARGNPGPAAIGVVVKDEQNHLLHQFGQIISPTTNNVAEYQAVIAALNWLIQHHSTYPRLNLCRFHLDSTLVVNQLNGLWKVKQAHLRQLIIHIRQLEGQLNSKVKINYLSIPREKNSQADALLNQALDQA